MNLESNNKKKDVLQRISINLDKELIEIIKSKVENGTFNKKNDGRKIVTWMIPKHELWEVIKQDMINKKLNEEWIKNG